MELGRTEGEEIGEDDYESQIEVSLNLCQVPFTTPLLYALGCVGGWSGRNENVSRKTHSRLLSSLSRWLSKCFFSASAHDDFNIQIVCIFLVSYKIGYNKPKDNIVLGFL